MNKKRIMRIFGRALYVCVARFLPVSYHRFGNYARATRGFCARLMLDQCGKRVNVERMAQFSSTVKIGNNSGIGVNATISSGTVIGNDVMMGPNCTIYTRNHKFDRTDIPMIEQGFQSERPVVINDDVWIGGNVIILPGVTVGNGSIVGAGSVVTRDILPYTVVAGNPARAIKNRITSSSVDEVEAISGRTVEDEQ